MTALPSKTSADDRARMLAELDELLEAERAGARATRPGTTDPGTESGRALIAVVHQDEVHWCGVLMKAIRTLGGSPGSRTGDFYGKVMALEDPGDRLRLLNRGQAWVVRRLDALLPRIDDPGITADLTAMREAHQVNIAQTEAYLARH